MKRIFIAALLGCAVLIPMAANAGERCPSATTSAKDLIARSSVIVLATALGDNLENARVESGTAAPNLRDIQDRARQEQPDHEGGGPLDRAKVFLPIQLFDAVDYIKGDGAARISVTTAAAPQGPVPKTNAPDHDDPAFWKDDAAGRGVLTENCGVAASFEPGARYLLFIGEPHVKAYEEIVSEDDSWLAYVKAQVAP